MYLLLLLPIAILVLLVGAFASTSHHGIRAALYVEPLSPKHRRRANQTLALTAVLVVSLEVVLWLGALPRIEHGVLFKVHLSLAVAYLAIIIIMRFFLTGKQNRGVHITLGTVCAASFVGMVTTGTILLARALLT